MKFPKLINGPTAEGEANARYLALDFAGAPPWLTIQAGNTRAQKKGTYIEVTQDDTAFPFLRTQVSIRETDIIYEFEANPVSSPPITQQQKYIDQFTFGVVAQHSTLALYVGDQFVLRIQGDAQDASNRATDFYGTMAYQFGKIDEGLIETNPTKPLSPTWINFAAPRLDYNQHCYTMFAGGWTDAGRFTFGYSFSQYNNGPDTGFPTSVMFDIFAKPTGAYGYRSPVCFVSNTGAPGLAFGAMPVFPSRDHSRFRIYCIAPGVLQYLQCVAEEILTTGPPTWFMNTKVPPFLGTSTDGGVTWSITVASFLESFLIKHPAVASSSDRDYYHNPQFEYMAARVVNMYVGSGTNILVVPACAVATTPGSHYTTACFISVDGGNTYNQVAWPADAWTYTTGDITTPDLTFPDTFDTTHGIVGCFQTIDTNAAYTGFGVGCFYVTVVFSDGISIMYTRNFGASWTISPRVPADMLITDNITGNPNDLAGFSGTVLKPYVDSDHTGQIIFSAPDFVNNKLNIYTTDGNFSVFKKSVAGKPAGTLVHVTGQGVSTEARNYTYMGDSRDPDHLPYVHPGFPGEFDKP